MFLAEKCLSSLSKQQAVITIANKHKFPLGSYEPYAGSIAISIIKHDQIIEFQIVMTSYDTSASHPLKHTGEGCHSALDREAFNCCNCK